MQFFNYTELSVNCYMGSMYAKFYKLLLYREQDMCYSGAEQVSNSWILHLQYLVSKARSRKEKLLRTTDTVPLKKNEKTWNRAACICTAKRLYKGSTKRLKMGSVLTCKFSFVKELKQWPITSAVQIYLDNALRLWLKKSVRKDWNPVEKMYNLFTDD